MDQYIAVVLFNEIVRFGCKLGRVRFMYGRELKKMLNFLDNFFSFSLKRIN